jgi:hypothetical protein
LVSRGGGGVAEVVVVAVVGVVMDRHTHIPESVLL